MNSIVSRSFRSTITAAIEEAMDLLVDAAMPVILVDQVSDSRETVDALFDFAEALGAVVINARSAGSFLEYASDGANRNRSISKI